MVQTFPVLFTANSSQSLTRIVHPSNHSSLFEVTNRRKTSTMSANASNGKQTEDSSEQPGCIFRRWGPGICAVNAEQKADKPCDDCFAQHPELLQTAMFNTVKLYLQSERSLPWDLFHEFSEMVRPAPPNGDFVCFSRCSNPSHFDFGIRFEWSKLPLRRRELRNQKFEEDVRFPNLLTCGAVKNPFALCEGCVQTMRSDFQDFIEDAESQQQKKLLTKDGLVTWECLMKRKPYEEDLAALWDGRFESDGPGSCQRVIKQGEICANHYKYYRNKPGTQEVMDKYFNRPIHTKDVPIG
jgi:hypothetical protein